MYPYRKSSTILAMLLLPAHWQASGPQSTLAALTDPAQRAALLATEKFTGDFLRTVTPGSLPAGAAEFAGLTVTEAARRGSRAGRGVGPGPPGEHPPGSGRSPRPARLHRGPPGLARVGRGHCAGSDGIYAGQHPHPRGYGAFARLAAHYLGDGSGAGYQRLARHLFANAADAYGLTRRARWHPGWPRISA